MNKRLKIAYMNARDPRDRRSWSGTIYYIGQALQKHCGEVYFLGPIKLKLELMAKVFHKASQKLLKKNYDYMHSISLAKRYARIFGRQIAALSPDLIFAPAASTEIAFLETSLPVVLLSDVTFTLNHNYYPEYSNLLNLSVREGNTVEQLAIRRARLLLYSSDWAARSAIKDYSADKAKVHVIPFGANIDEIPPKEIILQKKKSGRCRLLFLGVSWKRKGGEIAFETLLKLEEIGLQAELIFCGCKPPKGYSHRWMTVVPFLNKNDPQQRQALDNLLLQSDFLLLPTRADCSPIVFCEANAFGLPVITTDTGGVAGTIKNGENGFMLPLTAGGADYAELIAAIYRDDRRYHELVETSRAAFDERLNWDAWGIAARKLIVGMF